MVVSRNKDLINNLTDSDKNSYIKLRQSLDSLSDVALAEFDLSTSRTERKDISEFVSKKVREIIKEIGVLRGELWDVVNPARAKEFAIHSCQLIGSEELAKHSSKLSEAEEFVTARAEKILALAPEEQQKELERELTEDEKELEELSRLSRGGIGHCPPGFVEVDGICVPI